MARYKVLLVPGDGVGPEIMRYPVEVLEGLGVFEIVVRRAGLSYYREAGKPYEDDLFDIALEADGVLKGPLATPSVRGYESITLRLRRILGIYADIRPFHSLPGISLNKINVVIVREASEGIYSGIEGRIREQGISLKLVSKQASRRISEEGFKIAVQRGYRSVYAVHKATVLRATDGLFLETFYEVAEKYREVATGDMLVDSAAYRLVKDPPESAVLVTLNQYGDILSDVAAAVAGSIGLCASAQLGENGMLFEPIHGTGFDIAGKGLANPVSALRATQYLLYHIGYARGDEALRRAAEALDTAINNIVVVKGIRTPDIGGDSSTHQVATEIVKEWARLLGQDA
ncbi:homoisocitrate dehydrogenase [Pyrofollis japonicus]|uniref:isocitrate/isopropylmalate dehydrogenase family protein n=1 Tax=Pyrofollis japonicus TaxID=3060460 RepID=UPI00295BFFEF|nr:isocitrate/isopropylmalate family dehydrogenase [Pyrofollis japonicus]BEP17485.1 homoisocitrate dehydrogenase [Pyrofollis japonicus]